MRLILKKNEVYKARLLAMRAKRRARSKLKEKLKNYGKSINGAKIRFQLLVPAAVNIDAAKNRKSMIKFFDSLRKYALINKGHIVLDFSKTKLISPPAMLLFIAEIDRIRQILGKDFDIVLSRIAHDNVRQVLVQIGFFELCNLIPPKISSSELADNVRHWHFAAGERVNDDTNKAFEAIEGRITPEARKGIWRGLSEALVNSVQHAYVQPRGTAGPDLKFGRWWMFTEERDGKLTVAVCDLGIGIPRSLPLNWSESILSQIRAKLKLASGPDVTALRMALEVGQTRTGDSHRGKGLPQIWQAIRGSPGASILIHSNRARLVWNGNDDCEYERECEESINGTVVIWTVNTATQDS